jgi:DNA processing protein
MAPVIRERSRGWPGGPDHPGRPAATGASPDAPVPPPGARPDAPSRPPGPPVRPPAPDLEAIVRALALPGVGRARVTRAVRQGAPLQALARQVRSRLSEGEARKADGWARTALATIERRGIHVLTPDMEDYPETFRHLDSPPYAVFAAGRLELLRAPLIAIVGTRACTAQGRTTAARIAKGIAATGATIVSGLALGIDGAAHRAAGAARTIAILGCGLDVPYPLSHRNLQRDIGRHGLLLSEQLPGAPATGYHFPLRNRMIAALANAVVVVEAPEKSGALSTARHALDLGRPVFAVPGPVGARTTAGTNALLRDGGILVTSAREILDTLRLPVAPATGPDAIDEGDDDPPAELFGVGLALWSLLRPEARHVDELAAALGLDPRQTLASLLSLEVQGFARQQPGMRFARGE